MGKIISRCGICNCVSSEDIATNSGDWRPGTLFAPDPKSGDFDVCLSCLDSYQDVMNDFHFMDEEEEENESAFEYWDEGEVALV